MSCGPLRKPGGGGQGHNWGRSQLGGSSWRVHNWSVREGEVRAGGGSQMGGSHVEEVEEGRVCARTTGDQFLSPTAKSQRLLGCVCSFFFHSFLSLPPFILLLAPFPFLLPSSCLRCLFFNISCPVLTHKRAGDWESLRSTETLYPSTDH